MRNHETLRVSRKVEALGVLGLAALLTAGCTLVGYGIGALIDKGHPAGFKVVDGWPLKQVRKDTDVRVFLRDGREVKGVFRGLSESDEEYGPRYAEGRERHLPALVLPEIGERVRVITASGWQEGTFQGFDFASLSLATPKTRWLPFRGVGRLVSAGAAGVAGSELARLAVEGELPLRPRMLVGDEALPLETVRSVEAWQHGNKGKLIGALVGAAIDVVIVAAVISTLDDSYVIFPCQETGGCSSSCPFVHSFDGRDYVLEGETFGGALFEAAQKTDWMRLDHLDEIEGQYRLRLTNELQEIQYLDEVALVVVDTPEDVTIVPTREGRILPRRAPVSPTRAVDLRGRDVLALVRARDGEAWVSDPFGRNPDVPGDQRDGIELEFPRPPGARDVTLSATLQSTLWASSLLRDVLSLQGRELDAWSRRMNADAPARTEFFQALKREGLPILRVWAGTGWREAGFFANLGPAAAREQAVRVDLAGLPGDTLRVRLDATAGMWIVDGVSADFGADTPVQTLVLSPRVARTDGGQDIRGRLRAADGRRHVMAPGRRTVDLVYEAPPRRPGCRRSFVLQAAGYYTILVPAEGEPQAALFASLLREPGAFARYSLGRLHDRVADAAAGLEPSAQVER
jgi:hypothetical protein